VSARKSLLIASVNVNGLRAAITRGMSSWVSARHPDVITMQEVRAPDDLVADLVHEAGCARWHVAHTECAAKGRAGVAVASKAAIAACRAGLPGEAAGKMYDDSGRWLEADVATPDGRGLTVISCYVHTGDTKDEGRMCEKLSFLDAATDRMEALRAAGRHVLLTGDLNVGHTELDIKNWRGNRGKAGFHPSERARFDRWFDDLGWVDVGRRFAGDDPGPYSWWSWRGKAYDIDSGWRIDYHVASPELAAMARSHTVDRAATYAERWSDHAPVVVEYRW
jgi:exodeoxyribonuclease-3